jgi:hypothetical protein
MCAVFHLSRVRDFSARFVCPSRARVLLLWGRGRLEPRAPTSLGLGWEGKCAQPTNATGEHQTTADESSPARRGTTPRLSAVQPQVEVECSQRSSLSASCAPTSDEKATKLHASYRNNVYTPLNVLICLPERLLGVTARRPNFHSRFRRWQGFDASFRPDHRRARGSECVEIIHNQLFAGRNSDRAAWMLASLTGDRRSGRSV